MGEHEKEPPPLSQGTPPPGNSDGEVKPPPLSGGQHAKPSGK